MAGEHDRVIRILVAGDMQLIRGALVALLSQADDLRVVAETAVTGSCAEIISAARRTRADIVMIDIDDALQESLDAAEQLNHQLPDCRVLMLSGNGWPGRLCRAIKAHVKGFVVKDSPATQLTASVRLLADGVQAIDPELLRSATPELCENPLTPRETAVLTAAAGGESVEDISTRLSLADGTVRNYLSSCLLKVGARNRLDAVRIAREFGWI